jgi:EF hand
MICRRMLRCQSISVQLPSRPALSVDGRQLPRYLTVGLVALELCVITTGCSRGPAPVKPPYIDPAAASREAMELYDTDHDGQLSDKELEACPGILMHRDLYDTDHDGKISREEVEDRIRRLRASRVGLTRLGVQVRLDGRPLAGATVKLIPEKYLGSDIKAAVGTTGANGGASLSIPDEDLPASQHGLTGVHYGTYKVEITHPTIKVPAKYNTQTTLGYETERGNPFVDFDLKSR